MGVCRELFEPLTGHSGICRSVSIESTHIKAQRSAAGEQGGGFRQAIVPSPTPSSPKRNISVSTEPVAGDFVT